MTPAAARNRERFPELHPALNTQSALAEANRCLFCFDAPCIAACPTHIDVPRFIKKTFRNIVWFTLLSQAPSKP